MSSLVLSPPSALRPSDNQHLCNNQNNEHWHRLIMVDYWIFTSCWIFLNCLGEFGQTWCQLNLEGAGSMMDVFTGISRNTTSTRCFPDTFNNLVIFPREPDQELNHGLGKFWSLTLFDEIPEILTNFGFVARRWFVARSCVQFFCRGNLPCVDGYLENVLRVVLSSITSVVLCYLCYLRLLYSVFMDIWTC